MYNGITPIIAHPERNSSLRRDHSPLLDWIEFGCLSQLTGQSCTGAFGNSIQKFSFELIANNLVHFIASDAHRAEGRNPNLKDAFITINTNFGENVAQILFQRNPEKLINGLDIESLTLNTKNYLNLYTTTKNKKPWFKIFN